MSYILEALKKAEHEREIGQVPRIDSEHEPAAARASSRWVTLVVLVLLINAGLLLVLFWPDGSTGEVEPVARESMPALPRIDKSTTVSGGVGMQPGRQKIVTVLTTPATRPPPVSRPAAVVPVEPVHRPVPVVPPQQTENLPVWPQVPEFIFRKLGGGLRLDVLVYSDLPQDRFVLVNLQKYREGEQLQEGPLLDAITPDGIILSLQGQKFLVRAQ